MIENGMVSIPSEKTSLKTRQRHSEHGTKWRGALRVAFKRPLMNPTCSMIRLMRFLPPLLPRRAIPLFPISQGGILWLNYHSYKFFYCLWFLFMDHLTSDRGLASSTGQRCQTFFKYLTFLPIIKSFPANRTVWAICVSHNFPSVPIKGETWSFDELHYFWYKMQCLYQPLLRGFVTRTSDALKNLVFWVFYV